MAGKRRWTLRRIIEWGLLWGWPQVHRARLLSGEEVAVKIQYPGEKRALPLGGSTASAGGSTGECLDTPRTTCVAGVRESISSDIANLQWLLRVMGGGSSDQNGLFLNNICTEMKTELAMECDYRNEMRLQRLYTRLFERDFKGSVKTPRLIPELCSERVLTAELLRLPKVSDCGSLPQVCSFPPSPFVQFLWIWISLCSSNKRACERATKAADATKRVCVAAAETPEQDRGVAARTGSARSLRLPPAQHGS